MIKKILSMSCLSINNNKLTLIKTIALYFIIWQFLKYMNINNIKALNNKEEIESLFLLILLVLYSIFFSMMISITTFRIIILGKESVPKWGLFKMSKRELLYFFYIVIVASFILLNMIIVPFISVFITNASIIGVIFASILCTIIFSRTMLVFPAMSIEKKINFVDSWEMTKNHKLLVFSILIINLILSLFFDSLIGVIFDISLENSFYIQALVSEIVNLLVLIFSCTIIASTYKVLILRDEMHM